MGFLSFIDNLINNTVNKFTGLALTDAEREANAFTASREDLAYQRNVEREDVAFQRQVAREDLAWERSMQADNTKYQRQVADMQAAGINPMLAAGGAVAAPMAHSGGVSSSGAAGSGSSSVSPGNGNLGDLLSLVTAIPRVKAEIANVKADTKVKEAQAKEIGEKERGQRQQNDYFDLVSSLRSEAEALQNDMTRKQMRQYDQNIEESRSRVAKNISDISKNESDMSVNEARRDLFVSQAILANANADNIVYMRPYVAAYTQAKTSEARSQASLATVEAAYKQGLIDEGAISAMVAADYAKAREANSQAAKHDIETRTKEFVQGIRDGSLAKAAEESGDWRSSIVLGLYQGIGNAVNTVLGRW